MSVISQVGIPLLHGRNADGTLLERAAKDGNFSLQAGGASAGTLTLQTKPSVNGGASQAAVLLAAVVPLGFDQGAGNITATCGLAVTDQGNAGVQGTCTLAVYQLTDVGGANPISVSNATQNLPSGNSGYSQLTFDIDGATINPGDQLLLFITVSAIPQPWCQASVSLALVSMAFTTG